MLNTFKKLITDNNGWEMFVTGPAGTGKTTKLEELVSYCMVNEIPYVVCAYTHKACGILASKLPQGANVQTLHKFLTKRPTINDLAKHIQHLEVSKKSGKAEEYKVIFLDEYSMIGEKDYEDIGTLQNPVSNDPDAEPNLRVVYIGDSNQLPPVGDAAGIYPNGPYQIKLSKIWRQDGDNKLLETLGQLVRMIEGGPPEALATHSTFKRGYDLVSKYQEGDILLAYTNKRVEELNAAIAKKHEPEPGDTLFSPTLKQECTLDTVLPVEEVYSIGLAYGNNELALGSKYKTLEHLKSMDECDFMMLDIEDYEPIAYAVVFGHYQYKLAMQKYANAAAEANNNVPADNAKKWCANNKSHPLARARAKAWRDYLTFKECVICVDFPYAMTVHKSQGSTYDTVLVDTNDLYICAERDYGLYLKLMYVAISRASNKVYTS